MRDDRSPKTEPVEPALGGSTAMSNIAATSAEVGSRHNLPSPLTNFIGRERELGQVRHLLSTARLVTLLGAPGVGKTRLALEVGARVVDAYPDGARFVELAPIDDPTQLIPAVAECLGIRDAGRRPLANVLTEYLHERRLLLLLDSTSAIMP